MKIVLMQNKVDKSKMFVTSVVDSKKPMHNCKGYFEFGSEKYGVFKDNSILLIKEGK